MEVKTLYKQNKDKSIQVWTIWTEGSIIKTSFGRLNGAMQESAKEVEQKNVGRSNETTLEEQAQLEALSMWKHKMDKGYVTDVNANLTREIAPMLAQVFDKRKGKVKYWVDIQPKLDGCVFRTTQLQTTDGIKTIEEIVENKLHTSVLSFNEKSKVFEYKPVINWFNNGRATHKEWLEIFPEKGKQVKCTLNHKFLTEDGWKEAQDLDQTKDKIFSNQFTRYRTGLLVGTLLGDSCFAIDKRRGGNSYRVIFQHINKDYFDFKIKALGLPGKITNVTTGYGSSAFKFVSNAITDSCFPITLFYHTGHSKDCGKRKIISTELLKEYLTLEGLSLWISDDGSINYNNKNKETPRLSLSTHCFCDEQIENFVNYFKETFNCAPSVYTDKRVKSNGKFLTFSTKDTFFILTLLRKKQTKGYEYKFFYQTEGYLQDAKDEFKFISFVKRHVRNSPSLTKYDIEVADNHNYVANNIVIHNCRCLGHWENDRVVLLSRGNKEFNIPHIAKELESVLPRGTVFDGEIYVHGVPFQSITSWIKKERPETKDLQYWVYDCYEIGKENKSWKERSEKLLDLLFVANDSRPKIVLVCSQVCTCESEVYAWQKHFVANGFEGAIVRELDAPYEVGHRSNHLLKVKSFDDHEYKIVGFTHGEGKFSNCVIFD
jgi:predicted DNA-binding WGR domain protein